jgi:hypothetical protein
MRRPFVLLIAALVATTLVAAAAPAGASTDPQVPVVTITSPLAGSSHSALNPIRVEATASDADGTVVKVIFYRDGVRVFEATSAPYGFDLTGTSAGNHLLQANAYDNAGSVGVSAQVPITVVATQSPPVPVVVVRGVVVAGVEMGCLLLRPDFASTPGGPLYLLLGGDRSVLVPGARVEVYGRFRSGVVSFCMQGSAVVEVISARRI